MTKWEAIATPREFGGLEIINTRLINDCLLVKWIWRLVKKEDSLWCKILYGKYLKGKDFFSSSGRGGGGSQFWRGLHKVKKLFKWRTVHRVGKENQTRFWIDVWLDRVPLSVSFYELYWLIVT
jgi:hypothetical protein